MNTHTQQRNTSEAGFTLLFSVIVSILVLAVGASIISVALRQSVLSNTGRESQYAFYAANTGIECALYWDLNPPSNDITVRIFPYDVAGGTQTLDSTNIDAGNIECLGHDITDGSTDLIDYTADWDTDTPNRTSFTMAIKDQTGDTSIPDHFTYCAEVTVEKFDDDGDIVTQITSQGLNTCDLTNPRVVQRGLFIEYKE